MKHNNLGYERYVNGNGSFANSLELDVNLINFNQVISGNGYDSKDSLMVIIDDSEEFASHVTNFFHSFSCGILAIAEPMLAMGKLIDKQPDLILLDTIMPSIDGYSVCKFLRSTTSFKNVPIILITDYDTQSEREYAKFIGANDLFSRKSNLHELISSVKKYIPSLRQLNNDYRQEALSA